jgi:lipoprotein-releasing system permease protein
VNFEFKLAWAYFRARRKSLARFTATVAIVGIACGVASLIVAQSLTRGFRNEMQEKILSNTAHITVFQTDAQEISNWRTIKKELERIENIAEVSPTTYESAIIVGEKATSYAVLRARSAESGAESKNKSTSDSIEVSIGEELAKKTGLKPGDEAKIVLSLNASEVLPKTYTVYVRDSFRTGLYDYDSTWIYISFADLARAFEKSDFAPTVLSVAVKDIYSADQTAQKMRETLPPDFKVIDWQEANRPLFAALSLERRVSLAIFSLIIFIAALNITTTLALLVNERRLDIATLRTCGAQTRNLMSIFLLEGLLLGLLGIFPGVILGLSACFLGNYFKLIQVPSQIYSLSYVPLNPNLSDVLLIMAVTFCLCLAATLYPTWRAAKIKPLENLRQQ